MGASTRLHSIQMNLMVKKKPASTPKIMVYHPAPSTHLVLGHRTAGGAARAQRAMQGIASGHGARGRSRGAP